MFSAFGQPTRSPSPAFNPFAPKPSASEGNPFGGQGAGDALQSTRRSKKNAKFGDPSDNEAKRKVHNPFADNDASLSDSSKPKGKRNDDKRKGGDNAKKPHTNGGSDFSNKPKGQNGNAAGGSNPFARQQKTDPSRPTSSSSADSSDVQLPEAHHSKDPHARKVYEQLRKDGIHPPQWPSQPGNPQNKTEVSKFRERYEAYREKVRASLTKAGLIDDPEKRKTLQDAIDFKGICEDMCPEYEKITRINELDVVHPEKSSKTGFANTRRMVKKLARSAAGQEAPLPMDVRSIGALKRTLDYLIDDLLNNDDNLPGLHGFLWDRTRAIRRDFTFFSSLTPEELKMQVYVLENIARFHVTALHLLSQKGKAPEDFVEQQELEQLGKALLSLRDVYDDCNEQGINCENEAEFRAYYLVFHAFDSNIIETLQRQWRPNLWRDSDEVRTAVSLVETLQETQSFHGPLQDGPSMAASAAFHSYFRIVEDPKVSYTMACFAECHLPHLRRCILAAMKKSLVRPRETCKDVTASVLNKFLRFDTVQEAIDFAELHAFEFGPSEDGSPDPGQKYLVLDNRQALPHHRLNHQFSRSLVEKKRGTRSLPDLIHYSVMEDPNAKPTNGAVEESLFVSDSDTPAPQTSSFSPQPAAFAPFKPAGFTSPATNSLGSTANRPLPNSSSALPQQNPSAANNPFAPATAAATQPFFKPPQTPNGTSPFSAAVPTGLAATQNQTESPSSAATLNPFASSFKPADAPAVQAPAFSPFSTATAPKTASKTTVTSSTAASPFAGLLSAKEDGAKSEPSVLSGTATSTKTPDFKATMPVPSAGSSPFSQLLQPPAPTTLSLEAKSTQPVPASLSAAESSITKPAAPTFSLETPKIAKSNALSIPGTVSGTPPSLLPTVASSTPALPSQSSLPQPQTTASLQLGTIAKQPSAPPTAPPPPRDLMGDFTRWYVAGDQGLLQDFQTFMLENILQGVYKKFIEEEEKKRKQEEARRALQKATEFRVYSLSVKYFYRWRQIAREKRLSLLRRSGRDQMRSYHAAQRAVQLKAQKEAARQAARERAELAQLNRPEEFMDMLKTRKVSKRSAEEALLASGVLSGITDEQAAAAKIVQRAPSVNGSVTSGRSRGSSTSRSGGSKTQALREQFLGEPSGSFRRSLPPMPSRDGTVSEAGGRTSRVSERWRLKAMGIVQMPDGTALPESMANDPRYGRKRYSGISTMGPPSTIPRRASIADLTQPRFGARSLSGPQTDTDTPAAPATPPAAAQQNKRKRAAEDEGEAPGENDDTTTGNTHKRVMSDAQNLMNELRAMREEMEQGAAWFRDQNERLQSEDISRASTPWETSG